MDAATFSEVQPILGTRDVAKAVRFYVDRLGFALAFRRANQRGELRQPAARQRRAAHAVSVRARNGNDKAPHCRIVVDDPDALYAEYKDKDVFCEGTRLADTPWGTREFALYDLHRNSLTFYRDLQKPR
jgi:catechol 2,3-dioxygenase-like lactoylglutathione lyase family enzyme